MASGLCKDSGFDRRLGWGSSSSQHNQVLKSPYVCCVMTTEEKHGHLWQ